jgi:hypothetical protein
VKLNSALSAVVISICPLLCAAGAAAATEPISVTIQPSSSPATLRSTFNGFSYEKSNLTGPLLSPDNNSLIALYKLLGPGVVRSGGNSADQINWNPRGAGMTPHEISPPDIQRIAAFLRKVDWKIIYAVNLGRNTPASAAQEAAYVASTMGDRLLGIEIGNEPDLYSKNGLRSPSYGPAQFESEWQTYASAIKAQAPSVVLVGAASAGMPFTMAFVPALGKEVGLVTQHFYIGSGHEANARQKLLNNPDHYLENSMLPELYSLTKAVPVPYRMGECNAFGEPNTPANEFAAALWGIDFEFKVAQFHSAGINFHGGGSPEFTPIANKGSMIMAVNPIFYGMKLVSMAANGTLLKTDVSDKQDQFSAFAVAGNDGSTYVVLDNRDPDDTIAASIEFMKPVSSATSMLLTAPSVTSKEGVTLGGSPIGTDGSWSGRTSPVSVSGNKATVTVPAGSAMFIKALSGAPSGAMAMMAMSAAPPQAGSQPQAASTTLVTGSGGQCVDIVKGSRATGPFIQQHACNGSANQSFGVSPTSDGYVTVYSENNQLCLEAAGGSSPVIQNKCTGSRAQRWQLKKNGDGSYTFATSDSQGCLGTGNGGSSSAPLLMVYGCGSGADQKFKLSTAPTLSLRR